MSEAIIAPSRLAGWDALESGDLNAAAELFHARLQQSPNDPEALTGMGATLRHAGQLRDAVLHCDAAIRSAPSYAQAWLERGYVLATGGSIEGAAGSYLRASELDPSNAAALAGLASIAALRGDEAARGYAESALAIDPDNIVATNALAGIEIRMREFAPAAKRLRKLLSADDVTDLDRVTSLGLLGDALDGLDDTGGAFESYEKSKQRFAVATAPEYGGEEKSHRHFVERMAAALDAIDTANWTIPNGMPIHGAAATHIFLLGYPRSGNTLVETILASVDGVSSLEERPTLIAADQALLAGGNDLARLAALDEADAHSLREAYWAKVAASGAKVAGRVFVDMDPLKSIGLPLISRLFPDAKIVLVRRDPRDVVWSCFHTNFIASAPAYQFTTLEGTARHYDAVMRLTEMALDRLPLTTTIIRYEELVADFDSVTRELCTFVGLPWSPEMREFSRSARARNVSTASASQVRKALYDGSRQWERYKAHMEPILPILQPWVESFGYAA